MLNFVVSGRIPGLGLTVTFHDIVVMLAVAAGTLMLLSVYKHAIKDEIRSKPANQDQPVRLVKASREGLIWLKDLLKTKLLSKYN